jgi:hypothetical protein
MPAPVASGWSDFAGWALHPLESAALSRRTPEAEVRGPPGTTPRLRPCLGTFEVLGGEASACPSRGRTQSSRPPALLRSGRRSCRGLERAAQRSGPNEPPTVTRCCGRILSAILAAWEAAPMPAEVVERKLTANLASYRDPGPTLIAMSAC